MFYKSKKGSKLTYTPPNENKFELKDKFYNIGFILTYNAMWYAYFFIYIAALTNIRTSTFLFVPFSETCPLF